MFLQFRLFLFVLVWIHHFSLHTDFQHTQRSDIDLGYALHSEFIEHKKQKKLFIQATTQALSDRYMHNNQLQVQALTPYQIKAIEELEKALAGLLSTKNFYVRSVSYAYPGDYLTKLILLQDDFGQVERYLKVNGSTQLRKIDEAQITPGQYNLSDQQIAQIYKKEQQQAQVYNKSVYKSAKLHKKKNAQKNFESAEVKATNSHVLPETIDQQNKVQQRGASNENQALNTLLQEYTQVLAHAEHNQYPQSLLDQQYRARLENRIQALRHVDNPGQTYQAQHVSTQARDFMITHNLDYESFSGGVVTYFQDCLTREILDIVHKSVVMAIEYGVHSIIGQLATHTCTLAVSAQQFNQIGLPQQAVALTDLSHFFHAYGKLLVDARLYDQLTMDVSLGVIDGVIASLQGWCRFGQQLCSDPQKTLGAIASDCLQVGKAVGNLAMHIGKLSPFAYLDDMHKDMKDRLVDFDHNREKLYDQLPSFRMMDRTQQYAQVMQDNLYGALDVAYQVIGDMMQKSVQENVADGAQLALDNLIIGKITDALVHGATIVSHQLLNVGQDIIEHVPPHLLDQAVTFMQTTTGETVAVAHSSGENIGAAIAEQITLHHAQAAARFAAQTDDLKKRLYKVVKPDPVKLRALEESIKPYLSSDKIINIERLKNIKGVEQIEKFRDYTKNFTDLSKLKPEEILYLNLCDWLAPQAAAINAEIKAMGGLRFIDPATGAEVVIEKLDLFHSLLGEMKPGSIRDTTKGGHLLIVELRGATLEMDAFRVFNQNFLDTGIKYAGKISDTYKQQSYFPIGTCVQEAVDMIREGVKNLKEIKNVTPLDRFDKDFYEIKNIKINQLFKVAIEKGVAQFHPLAK